MNTIKNWGKLMLLQMPWDKPFLIYSGMLLMIVVTFVGCIFLNMIVHERITRSIFVVVSLLTMAVEFSILLIISHCRDNHIVTKKDMATAKNMFCPYPLRDATLIVKRKDGKIEGGHDIVWKETDEDRVFLVIFPSALKKGKTSFKIPCDIYRSNGDTLHCSLEISLMPFLEETHFVCGFLLKEVYEMQKKQLYEEPTPIVIEAYFRIVFEELVSNINPNITDCLTLSRKIANIKFPLLESVSLKASLINVEPTH